MMYTLDGVDGNAFSVMSYVSNAMKHNGMRNEISQYQKKAMSGNYDNLICVSMDFLDKINERCEDEDFDW